MLTQLWVTPTARGPAVAAQRLAEQRAEGARWTATRRRRSDLKADMPFAAEGGGKSPPRSWAWTPTSWRAPMDAGSVAAARWPRLAGPELVAGGRRAGHAPGLLQAREMDSAERGAMTDDSDDSDDDSDDDQTRLVCSSDGARRACPIGAAAQEAARRARAAPITWAARARARPPPWPPRASVSTCCTSRTPLAVVRWVRVRRRRRRETAERRWRGAIAEISRRYGEWYTRDSMGAPAALLFADLRRFSGVLPAGRPGVGKHPTGARAVDAGMKAR